MADIVEIRTEAVNLAKQAVEMDDNEKYEDACKLYIKAADKLKYLSQIDENAYNKDTYRKKAIEYCERAKILKDSVMSSKQHDEKKAIAEGGT
jgi:hypothetical protein